MEIQGFFMERYSELAGMRSIHHYFLSGTLKTITNGKLRI